jgi:hypothetical protein
MKSLVLISHMLKARMDLVRFVATQYGIIVNLSVIFFVNTTEVRTTLIFGLLSDIKICFFKGQPSWSTLRIKHFIDSCSYLCKDMVSAFLMPTICCAWWYASLWTLASAYFLQLCIGQQNHLPGLHISSYVPSISRLWISLNKSESAANQVLTASNQGLYAGLPMTELLCSF